MKTSSPLGLFDHLTHKANLKDTRYGWLRLTPAHSVHLVSEILSSHTSDNPTVLDPFCGTGTTALVCAEHGIVCDTIDINPFLIWLTRAKTRFYSANDIATFEKFACDIKQMLEKESGPLWTPPLHQIEKWWQEADLSALSRVLFAINADKENLSEAVSDLLKISFCRVMIETAKVSFNHQSMSFKKEEALSLPLYPVHDQLLSHWSCATTAIAKSARVTIVKEPRALLCDARDLANHLSAQSYSCVITSPPYPNRMSYIRELRPYMYWLGYLTSGRDAGELDWQAIGGTWGIATSNVGKWQPEVSRDIPYPDFTRILGEVAKTSPLLSRYIHKYFYDMAGHLCNLYPLIKAGGTIHYIVGNSKFYDVLLPVEQIFASLFEFAGFQKIEIRTIRKRTSKKELYEFIVTGRKF